MENCIDISIIIPIYNMEKYLKACVDSVVAQEGINMEILLIDDGSKDSSLQICREFEQKNPKIVRVITKENGGQGQARNIGLRKAKGKYVGFVDADDYIEQGMFCKMLELAQKEYLDYVECDYLFVEEVDGGECGRKKYGEVRRREAGSDLFLNPLVSPWNKIYRRSILIDNDIYFPEGLIYEDTGFYIKAVPFLKKVGFVDYSYVHHFYRKGSTMTSSKWERVADIFDVLKDSVDFYQRNESARALLTELEYFCVKILLCSSMKRISAIDNKMMKREFVNKTWDMIERYFPNYRKNPYMNGGKINLYMKYLNRRRNRLLINFL